MIIGPADSLYEGGFLRAELVFPPEYPLLPPTLKFLTQMWHPNGEALKLPVFQSLFGDGRY